MHIKPRACGRRSHLCTTIHTTMNTAAAAMITTTITMERPAAAGTITTRSSRLRG